MSSTYAISPDVAKRAVENYLVIVKAGLLPVLYSEIRQAVAYQRSQQWLPSGQVNRDAEPLDGFRNGNGWALAGIAGQAGELARILECDAADVLPYLFDGLWTGPTTRRIAIEAMATVAGHARKQIAEQERKAKYTGRRAS